MATGDVLSFIRFASDIALTVPSQIDLRPYVITMNQTSWDGGRPGVGNETFTSFPLTNGILGYNLGLVNAKYRQVTMQEIALSGGQLKDLDVCIGPMCFLYDTGTGFAGGIDPLTFTPAAAPGLITEVYFNIQGPNFPAGGDNFTLVKSDTSKNVMYRIFLRNKAVL